MPYADNCGIRIYYEAEGHGVPLLLVHGFGMNIDLWRAAGYVTALADDYQLILTDVRGHGRSDKPHHAEAYGPNELTDDLFAVLDDLGCGPVHYFGHSGGAAIGFLLAAAAPTRFRSLVLGGYGPFMSSKQMDLYARMRSVAGIGLHRLVASIERTAPLTPEQRAVFMSNDIDALAAWAEGGIKWPALGHLLGGITAPTLVYCGEDDPNYDGARQCVSNMPRATFAGLPNVGHIDSFLCSDLVLPMVQRFLSEVDDEA